MAFSRSVNSAGLYPPAFSMSRAASRATESVSDEKPFEAASIAAASGSISSDFSRNALTTPVSNAARIDCGDANDVRTTHGMSFSSFATYSANCNPDSSCRRRSTTATDGDCSSVMAIASSTVVASHTSQSGNAVSRLPRIPVLTKGWSSRIKMLCCISSSVMIVVDVTSVRHLCALRAITTTSVE